MAGSAVGIGFSFTVMFLYVNSLPSLIERDHYTHCWNLSGILNCDVLFFEVILDLLVFLILCFYQIC